MPSKINQKLDQINYYFTYYLFIEIEGDLFY